MMDEGKTARFRHFLQEKRLNVLLGNKVYFSTQDVKN